MYLVNRASYLLIIAAAIGMVAAAQVAWNQVLFFAVIGILATLTAIATTVALAVNASKS